MAYYYDGEVVPFGEERRFKYNWPGWYWLCVLYLIVFGGIPGLMWLMGAE